MNGPIRKKLGIIPKNVTWGGAVSLLWTFSQEILFFFSIDLFYAGPLSVQARQRTCSATWQETS